MSLKCRWSSRLKIEIKGDKDTAFKAMRPVEMTSEARANEEEEV